MIGKIIQFLVDIFRFHKLKVFFVLVSAVIFSVIVFSYDDLSEVVTTTVAEHTNNQVFLQFDSLGIQFFPFPALAIENVEVESVLFPKVQASRLSLAPSIAGFLSFRPGFHIGAKGIWDGTADVDMKTGKKTEQGVAMQNLQMELDGLDVAKIGEVLGLPLKIQGRASGEGRVLLDPTFATQPEGDMEISAKELRFPPGTIPTQMGPMTLPGMSWSVINGKARLAGNKLSLEKLTLGSSTDLFNGNAKGEFDVRFEPRGAGHIEPSWGPYSLTVELNVSPKVERELGAFLFLLSSYKSPTNTGSRYRFKLAGTRFGVPPTITPATGP